jgi:hypothetical protein
MDAGSPFEFGSTALVPVIRYLDTLPDLIAPPLDRLRLPASRTPLPGRDRSAQRRTTTVPGPHFCGA